MRCATLSLPAFLPPVQGDYVVYYSPRTTYPDGEPLQAFTALDHVLDDAPERVAQPADFHPYRRRVQYFKAREARIQPLLAELALTQDRKNWGILFRRSSVEIGREDFEVIWSAMGGRGSGSEAGGELLQVRTAISILAVRDGGELPLASEKRY